MSSVCASTAGTRREGGLQGRLLKGRQRDPPGHECRQSQERKTCPHLAGVFLSKGGVLLRTGPDKNPEEQDWVSVPEVWRRVRLSCMGRRGCVGPSLKMNHRGGRWALGGVCGLGVGFLPAVPTALPVCFFALPSLTLWLHRHAPPGSSGPRSERLPLS